MGTMKSTLGTDGDTEETRNTIRNMEETPTTNSISTITSIAMMWITESIWTKPICILIIGISWTMRHWISQITDMMKGTLTPLERKERTIQTLSNIGGETPCEGTDGEIEGLEFNTF